MDKNDMNDGVVEQICSSLNNFPQGMLTAWWITIYPTGCLSGWLPSAIYDLSSPKF